MSSAAAFRAATESELPGRPRSGVLPSPKPGRDPRLAQKRVLPSPEPEKCRKPELPGKVPHRRDGRDDLLDSSVGVQPRATAVKVNQSDLGVSLSRRVSKLMRLKQQSSPRNHKMTRVTHQAMIMMKITVLTKLIQETKSLVVTLNQFRMFLKNLRKHIVT